MYPISTFDSGTIYHEVQRFCDNHNQWGLFSSNVAIGMAKNLQHPLFYLQNTKPTTSESSFDVADELLAEALMSLFRGMPRLTVLNSYGAVELLANVTFTEKSSEALVRDDVPEKYARELAESKRRGNNRTDPSFLFHRGLKEACGRSLHDEQKQKYDELVQLQKLRHDVAHLGKKPSEEIARAGHKLCCEVAQWLGIVMGRAVKPLLPKDEDVIAGLNVSSNDTFSTASSKMDMVRHVVGVSNVDFGSIPSDLTALVRQKVSDGTYPNQLQVVIDALRNLLAREKN